MSDTGVGEATAGEPDGRPCSTSRDCYFEDADPGAEYACERIGLMGTTSVGRGRVRYRGVLQDPNELALAAGIGLPWAFALQQRRRHSPIRLLVLGLALVAVLACAVLTGSRGGQLVCLSVLAVYFAKRFGWSGLLLAAGLTAPIFMLGGRDGAEASRSTIERIGCWSEALEMWREHPLLGVGL